MNSLGVALFIFRLVRGVFYGEQSLKLITTVKYVYIYV